MYVENGEDEVDLVTAIVAPDGIDAYPKYLVHFGRVLEYCCYEELFCSSRGYELIDKDVKDLSAYEWVSSPKLENYENGLAFLGSEGSKRFYHYVLFGADNIAEIICEKNPTIEPVNCSTKLTIELNV